MPVYDYLCDDCGAFTDMRPMAECDLPSTCRSCGADAPRVMLTAPNLSAMSAARFQAAAVNERSANAPRLKSHGAGCACCAGSMRRGKGGSGSSTDGNGTAGGARSFPSRRPWMISH